VKLENRSKYGRGQGGCKGRERKESFKGQKEESLELENKKRRREVSEGTDSGQHHPAIEDGEISYSLRESRSLKDSNEEWHKEWQC